MPKKSPHSLFGTTILLSPAPNRHLVAVLMFKNGKHFGKAIYYLFSLQWISPQKLESNILFSLDTYFKLMFGAFKAYNFQDPLIF